MPEGDADLLLAYMVRLTASVVEVAMTSSVQGLVANLRRTSSASNLPGRAQYQKTEAARSRLVTRHFSKARPLGGFARFELCHLEV